MITSNVPRRRVGVLAGAASVFAVSALLLGACSSGVGTPTSSAPAPQSAAPTPTPTPTVASVAPLTGEVVDGPITHPSIASKIDNHIAARPQVGLQHTDLVFEELVEGGLTRYIAVWHSQIPKLYGPVRSIRGMDPSIVSPLGGIMTYSGGQPIFVEGMEDTDVENVVYDQIGTSGDIFYRTAEKSAPHNVMAKAENLLEKYGDGLEAPKQQFEYAAGPASSTAATAGTPTTTISPTFSDVSLPTWKWDGELGKWLRFQTGGAKDVDDAGKQLKAVNVVTLRVKLKTISHTPVSQLIGSNKATVSTDGKTVEGTWTKKSDTDPISLTDEAGNPITLAPGNTWVELVATGGSVSYE